MKHASIEILRLCPNNCKHCSSDSGPNTNDYIIPLDTIKNVFDGLKRLGAEEVSISGGEPFLHKDLVNIVKYGKEKGFKIFVYTSGIIFDNNNKYTYLNEEIIKELSEINLDKLIFNFQSLKEDVYNNIMGNNGNLNLVKKSIEISRKNNIWTELHFVPMKYNYKEIPDIIKYVYENSIDRVSFLGLVPHGRAKNNREELYLNEEENMFVKTLLNRFNTGTSKIRVGIPLQLKTSCCKCNAVSNKLYIKFDGNVYGCEAFKYYPLFDNNNEEIHPDNIFDKDIEWIYKNSEYLKASLKEKSIIFKRAERKESCPIQEEYRELK